MSSVDDVFRPPPNAGPPGSALPGHAWPPPAPPSRRGLHPGALAGPVARNQRAKTQAVGFADPVTVAGLPVVEPDDDDDAVQAAMLAMEKDDRIVESFITTYADDENAVDVAALRPTQTFTSDNLRSIRRRALAGAQGSVE